MVAIRYQLTVVAGDRAPYAFNFVAVVIAAVLAGWRSGAIALVLCQLLTWHILVDPLGAPATVDSERTGAFVLATLAQLMVLTVIALYQREVGKGVAERERRVELLNRALEEIDHRTRNNYQTVLALVQLQAQRSKHSGVREALGQVADRIEAVTLATQRLGHRGEDLGMVRLRDHLCELCEQVERGLSRDGVKVECDIDDLIASTEKAAYLSIIVNELVTNALKHAFREAEQGTIRVKSEQVGQQVAIIVEDDGNGMEAPPDRTRSGLGTRLVERFARELGCRHEIQTSTTGTKHRLLIASLT